MKNKELENIIKNDVNFFIEVGKRFKNYNVTEVINFMEEHAEDFIRAYYESKDFSKEEYEGDISSIEPPQEVNNLADYSKNDTRHFTEYNGRDINKFNNKLYWIIIITLLFTISILFILFKDSKAQTNSYDEKDVTEEVHLLHRKMDTCYNNYIVNIFEAYPAEGFDSTEMKQIIWECFHMNWEDLDIPAKSLSIDTTFAGFILNDQYEFIAKAFQIYLDTEWLVNKHLKEFFTKWSRIDGELFLEYGDFFADSTLAKME